MTDIGPSTDADPRQAPPRTRGPGRPAVRAVALRPADAEEARRTAERLSAELAELIRAFPLERRTVSEMARWLGITRPICQRVVQAARHRGDPLLALTHLPGAQGLASFVVAAERASGASAAVEAVKAAAARYKDLIDRHGGSQARLVAAIEAHRREQPERERARHETDDAEADGRRLIFEGVRAMIRREAALQVGAFVYRPVPEDPGRIDCITAMGLVGVRAQDGAMPICPVSTFAYGDPEEAPDDLPVGPVTDPDESTLAVGRLDEFCSDPPPRIIARRRGGRVSVLVEPDQGTSDAFDVMLAARFSGVPHPALHDPKMQTCWLHSDGPARRLIIAVHLHRSLAMRSVAMSGAYVREHLAARIPGRDGHVHVLTPAEVWADRLPDVPPLEYLGLGLEQAATAAYARQRELLRHLLDLQGWSEDEFVGYRLQVDYPVWNAQYVVHFDFDASV